VGRRGLFSHALSGEGYDCYSVSTEYFGYIVVFIFQSEFLFTRNDELSFNCTPHFVFFARVLLNQLQVFSIFSKL
jgi:hypothetical protein